MQIRRIYVLTTLASLTVFFLGSAAYSLWQWHNNTSYLSASSLSPDPLLQANMFDAEAAIVDVPTTLHLTVMESGIAAVSMRQLQAENWQLDYLSAENIRLSQAGQSIPFYVDGEGEEAVLYFYAQAVTNTLEAPAAYRLSLGQGTAMKRQNAQPDRPGDPVVRYHYRWEENSTFLAQTEGSDLWLGPLILAPNSWNLSLADVQSNGDLATLKIRIWSSTEAPSEPDHHIEVLINGRKMTSWYWDGIKQETITIPLPPGELQSDYHNLLTIHAPGDTGATGEAIYIDWIDLEYYGSLTAAQAINFSSDAASIRIDEVTTPPMLFDVTDKDDPILLTNYTYEDNTIHFAGSGPNSTYTAITPNQAIRPTIKPAPHWETSLRQTNQGADYIAVVADVDGFDEAVQPLLTYREDQGMRVMAVSLMQIYDEFGYGQQTPDAIRSFLNYAVTAWQPPAPQFVLLVGDATYDIHNQINGKNKNLLPAHFTRLDYGGYVANDDWFVSLETETPLAIGRFPVQTAAQLQTMVEKTIIYETTTPQASWSQLALLVADDEPKFDITSNELAEALNAGGYQTYRLYMTQKENIHYDIISALNQGVGLVNYIGHGGETVWGDEAVLQAEDASMLANYNRLPIFTTFTCLNGAFAHPQIDSLAESLLWAEEGGIVAAIAPSGRSATGYQLPIMQAFYEHLLSSEVHTLGELLVMTKSMADDNPNLSAVLKTVNLLGDPALQIQRPTP